MVAEAGHFQDERYLREGGMRHDASKAVAADVPFADVLVAVADAAERNLGVVGMAGDEPVQPDLALELVDSRLQPVVAGQVVAHREGVLRVQAHLHALVADLANDRAELAEVRADAAAHAGAVLEDEPGVARRHGEDAFDGLGDAFEDGVEAGAFVAARVDDAPLRADPWRTARGRR